MILPSTLVPQIFKAVYTNPLMNTLSHGMYSPPSPQELESSGLQSYSQTSKGLGNLQLTIAFMITLPERETIKFHAFH